MTLRLRLGCGVRRRVPHRAGADVRVLRLVQCHVMAGGDAIQERLDGLRAIPPRIAAATDGLDAEGLLARTGVEPWSVNDILAHLRAAADNRTRFIRRMASGDHTTLAYASARSELRKTDYVDRSFADNLAAFTRDRAVLVEWLETLREAWSRGALIRDRRETVATYARYLVEHELAHCAQIEALVR